VGVRTGNLLSEDEAELVLDAIASVPVDLGVHREVGPSQHEVGIRIAIGLAVAIVAFALIFPGMTDPSRRWLVGIGDLLLLWVAYRFWFNLFRRRPEYAQ
jgi:small-conductance mechanosensitive channel